MRKLQNGWLTAQIQVQEEKHLMFASHPQRHTELMLVHEDM